MSCQCPNIDCVETIDGGTKTCTCTYVLTGIICPEGCTKIVNEDGSAFCNCVESIDPTYIDEKINVDLDDENYFEDVSWTIAFSPSSGGWLSYYSFLPKIYNNLNNYFQTYDGNSMWSHLLTNSSYGVFYGQKQPMIIESVIVTNGNNRLLESVTIESEAKRFRNEWEYSFNKDLGFNKAVIYNATNNSGELLLTKRKSLADIPKFPKTISATQQEILYTSLASEITFNMFYNRVINQDNNIELWNVDVNNINKTINPSAVSFKFKKSLLERMKGDYFIVRMIYDADSRYNILLRDFYSTNQNR